ncbi:uncharacterized protein LOC133204626 [Saccostrea echinata]|uniref:uncharacterized protein LOC133204626 n=1 Tax=Saccostrea echinata TaxID=191078 RepID=UPI002A7F1F07|nr:uncharacterized protein LOC133204626 [Saccostrea echinata]
MFENCGNQSLEIKQAVIIEARRNATEYPPSLNCSLPVHTVTNHSIQINIEMLEMGDGVNCSWKRPQLDFCVNYSCNVHECGLVKRFKSLQHFKGENLKLELLLEEFNDTCNFQLVVTSTYPKPCNTGDWQCFGTKLCINGTLYCDGHKNCPKGDDEDVWRCHPRQPMDPYLMGGIMIGILVVIFAGQPSLTLLQKLAQ